MVEHEIQTKDNARAAPTDLRVTDVVQAEWKQALGTEEYEVAAVALDEVRALGQWRQAARQSPFGSFYQIVEAASLIEHTNVAPEEKMVLRKQAADVLMQKAHALSPRVADLYQAFLAQLEGTSFTPQFPMTEEKIDQLRASGDLDLLLRSNASFPLLLNRMQARLEGELLGRKALDRRDRQVAQEDKQEAEEEQVDEQEISQKDEETMPPPDNDTSKPGMDEMSRLKEGEEAGAIWTIKPAYGGYYKEKSFGVWDATTNTWRQANNERDHVNTTKFVTENKKAELVMHTTIPMRQWTCLPLSYQYEISNIHMVNSDYSLAKDKNGDYIVRPENQYGNVSPHAVTIEMVKKENPSVKENPPAGPFSMPATLLEDTQAAILEIQNTRKTNIDKARALARYTMQHLTYSNDSSYNALYENYQDGYIGAIDKFKKADCDVANTYFAALCSKLNIPVRHVVGHMVKGKNADGNSVITNGTGHAWTEVWDNNNLEWVRIDATPPGDPQLQEEQQPNGENPPGDYGTQEAVGPTDEELKQLEERLATTAEKLSYTKEERYLSEAGGVELKEAREIVKEIRVAENAKLPNGELVKDVMSGLFDLIIETRKTRRIDYRGPLRQREGGQDIDDIVAHALGIKAGDMDPQSRRIEHPKQKTDQVFGGFDAYIIGDKSGSMSNTVNGEEKWKLQRRAEYLIFSSLHRFNEKLKHEAIRMTSPLSVRSQGISFRNKKDIDIDKPLSAELTAVNKVTLWHSLGNQGNGNGDVAALSQIYDQIKAERNQIEAAGKKDDRLRIVIACSDGAPDDAAGVKALAQKLGELNAVVVGIGLTETAAAVPIIFNTPFSRGDIVKDINDLPIVVAKQIIMGSARLFPDRVSNLVVPNIRKALAKFAQAA